MPTYEFSCPKCGASFTAIQPLSEAIPKPKCKVCKIPLERIFGLQTVIFKGSGWAKNDS